MFVLYRRFGGFAFTTIDNYLSYVQNVRKINQLAYDFSTFEECIDYMVEWLHIPQEKIIVIR